MRKFYTLLVALLITVFVMLYSPTRAESSETPIPMSIDIVQGSTEVTVGETITASWTYSAALPLEYYDVQLIMSNADDTFEAILFGVDRSVTSFSYTPTQAGTLDLRISIRGADGQTLIKKAKWTIAEDAASPEVIPMSINIVQDRTEAVVGETITASWTYTAAEPLESYNVHFFMSYADNTPETILLTGDRSVTSFSYTPAQAGTLYLNISIHGADGRILIEDAQWTITEGAVPPKAPGDANGDGTVSLKDALAILEYLANGHVSVNLRNSDVNGDGKVNSYDVLLILQHVAGWN
nr:dockerin type I repeat-containing protein [Clostridia bacterium]